MKTNNAVLLVSCPDEAGLVHKITGALFDRKLNIIENSEIVDHHKEASGPSHFFMRTEFTGSFNGAEILRELKAKLPLGASIEIRPERERRLVIFASHESHCLGDLLLRHEARELKAKICAVISQYGKLRKLSERFGIPFHEVPVPEAEDRSSHERMLEKACQAYRPDLIVLAKYMRILSPAFVEKYPQSIVNIHHSFLPAFVGAKPYHQAYERGVKIIGATAHFVTEDLDEGPIITQLVTHVKSHHGPQEMARIGRETERLVLAQALNLVLDDRVLLSGRRTIVFE